MNNLKRLFCSVLILVTFGLGNSFAQKVREENKPLILFLGTYHFNNPGADIVNPEVDDVLSARRQKEILEINNLLKKFAPTMIGIEQVPESTVIGERYDQFVQGKYELGRNEIYQIAFRLGKDLGHPRLYQIDSNGTYPYGAVQDFARIGNQTETFDKTRTFFEKGNDEFNERQKTQTMRESLLFMNQAGEIEKEQAAYLRYVKIGSGRLYPGADLLTAWYQRNLRIFANITRMEAKAGDRILVLIGAGHLALLRQFAKDSGDYKLIEVKDYLGK